jgi:hypothetical protein
LFKILLLLFVDGGRKARSFNSQHVVTAAQYLHGFLKVLVIIHFMRDTIRIVTALRFSYQLPLRCMPRFGQARSVRGAAGASGEAGAASSYRDSSIHQVMAADAGLKIGSNPISQIVKL